MRVEIQQRNFTPRYLHSSIGRSRGAGIELRTLAFAESIPSRVGERRWPDAPRTPGSPERLGSESQGDDWTHRQAARRLSEPRNFPPRHEGSLREQREQARVFHGEDPVTNRAHKPLKQQLECSVLAFP